MPASVFLLVLALLAAEPSLDAKQSPIAALLASKNPRLQCWGAWRAAASKSTASVPALRAVLRTRLRGATADPRVSRAALDALVRLRGEVPTEELTAAYKRHRVEALILMAQDPQAHERALAGLLETDLHHGSWTAVCNLLEKRRSPALVRHLMQGLELELGVCVFDPGTIGGMSIGGGSGRGRILIAMVKVPSNWPPRTNYTIHEQPTKSAVLLAPGRRPAYYGRKVFQPGRSGRGDSSLSRRKTTAERLGYLAAMLDAQPADLPVRTFRSASAHWTNKRDLLAAVEAARAKLAADYDRLAAMFVAAHILSREDPSQLDAKIRVRLHDRRANRQTPLPKLGN